MVLARLGALLIATVAFVVFWLLMVFPYDGGGSIHHTVLLWPLPRFIVGTMMAPANAAVTNEHYVELETRGPSAQWSDASYPLAASRLVRLRSNSAMRSALRRSLPRNRHPPE